MREVTGQGPGQQGSPQTRTRGWEGSQWPQLLRAPRPYSSSAWEKEDQGIQKLEWGRQQCPSCWRLPGPSQSPPALSRPSPASEVKGPGPVQAAPQGWQPSVTFSPQPSSPQRLIVVQNPNPLILPAALPLTPPPLPAPRRTANQISPGTGADQALSHSAAKGPQGKDACSPFTDGKTRVHRWGPPRPPQVSGGTGRQSQACTAPNAALQQRWES